MEKEYKELGDMTAEEFLGSFLSNLVRINDLRSESLGVSKLDMNDISHIRFLIENAISCYGSQFDELNNFISCERYNSGETENFVVMAAD